jgi:hypothetical protein
LTIIGVEQPRREDGRNGKSDRVEQKRRLRWVQWYLAGKLKLDELASATMPLEKINDGFQCAQGRRGRPSTRFDRLVALQLR